MNLHLAGLFLMLCAACAAPACGATLFSSLDQPDPGVGLAYFRAGFEFASDFRTAQLPVTVRGLVVQITNIDETVTGDPSSGRDHVLEAFLYASGGGRPGELVRAFAFAGVSRSRSLLTSFNDPGITLAPNTEYWIGIRAHTTQTWGLGGLVQGSTNTNELSAQSVFASVPGTPLFVRSPPGNDWTALLFQGNLLLSLHDTAVPEPATVTGVALGLMALGFRRRRAVDGCVPD